MRIYQTVIISAVTAILFISVSYAQFTNVRVGGHIGRIEPEEPSIAVSLADQNNMVAGANIDNVYQSTDGGNTWTHSVLTSSYGVYGDPCIISDTEGRFFFFPSLRSARLCLGRSYHVPEAWQPNCKLERRHLYGP